MLRPDLRLSIRIIARGLLLPVVLVALAGCTALPAPIDDRFIEKGHRPGENVYLALGQSAAGRHLAVFFVYKSDQRALVVSARDMTHTERRQYDQR